MKLLEVVEGVNILFFPDMLTISFRPSPSGIPLEFSPPQSAYLGRLCERVISVFARYWCRRLLLCNLPLMGGRILDLDSLGRVVVDRGFARARLSPSNPGVCKHCDTNSRHSFSRKKEEKRKRRCELGGHVHDPNEEFCLFFLFAPKL